jgi:hypothetical protein
VFSLLKYFLSNPSSFFNSQCLEQPPKFQKAWPGTGSLQDAAVAVVSVIAVLAVSVAILLAPEGPSASLPAVALESRQSSKVMTIAPFQRRISRGIH